jgi:serine/threonine protein kinase, bacterial
VIDRPEIIKKLESKLAETLRDRQLVAEVSGNKADRSALAEYGKISQNANIPPGIRYLALHCIADKQGFYADPRDKSQMVATVSQAMGSLVPSDVVKAIECLKTQYSSIYQLDDSFFDRYEAHAVEFMTRVPVDRQDKTVADNKDTQLNPLPIITDRLPIVSPPQPVSPAMMATQISNDDRAVNNHYNSPPTQVDPHQNRAEIPTQNGNKGALIIAGAIIVAASIFSSALFSSRNSQTDPIVTDIPKRVETPTSSSSDNTDRTPPDALIAQYYQEINSRNYQAAWNKLPNNLREDLNVHPNGYQSFVDFFNGFGGVRVNNLTVVDRTDYSAVVNADLSCHLKNGNDSPLFLRFSLNWNNSDRQWQMSKIRFNPERKSYCGVSN